MLPQIVKYKPEHLPQVTQIFFDNSSVKNFNSQFEKSNFFNKWLNPYVFYWSQDFWIAESLEKTTFAYLAGCPSSLLAEPVLKKENASFSLFREYFFDYPAHFHINVSAKAQGQGIGRLLVHNFEKQLKIKGIQGLHVVTSSDQENIKFYTQLGFQILAKQPVNSWLLVCLGKRI